MHTHSTPFLACHTFSKQGQTSDESSDKITFLKISFWFTIIEKQNLIRQRQ